MKKVVGERRLGLEAERGWPALESPMEEAGERRLLVRACAGIP
jgi:hypothetical protein